MKFCTVAAVLLVSLFATSMALPASYYQQPSFYYQSRAAPQRLMYMQYVQQPASVRTRSRLTNAAAAYVAGDSVATGTYVKDNASEEQQTVEESVLDNTGANGAQSIAEAYPAASSEVEDSQYDGAADVAPAPQAQELPEDNQVYQDEVAPVAEDADPEPAVSFAIQPAVAAVPEPAAVELPEDAENDDDEEAEADSVVPNNARKVPQKGSPAPLPAGTFFPIDFGGASGGSIAVSNSFSTGVNGSAKSQAIAYGKPETPSIKSRPIRRRH